MDEAVAVQSVDLLLSEAAPGERLLLAFMGGEPLTNRRVLRLATERAARLASQRGVEIGFSITSNGTLIQPEDGAFFEQYGFAVTISLDGAGDAHDRLRPFAGGGGSYRRIVERIAPLLRMQRRMQVSARVTVTPDNLELRQTLDEFIGMGFHSVGFSPMLSAPGGTGEMCRNGRERLYERLLHRSELLKGCREGRRIGAVNF